MRNSKAKLVTAALVITFGSMLGACGGVEDGGLAGALAAAGVAHQNFDICHNTSSDTNPWLAITVNTSSVKTHVDHHGDGLKGQDGYSCEERGVALYGPEGKPPADKGWDCMVFPNNPGCTATPEEKQAAREQIAAKAAEAALANGGGAPVEAAAKCEGWGMVLVDRQHCEVGQAVVLVYGNFTEHPVLTGPEGACEQGGVRTEEDGKVRYAFICNYLDNEALSYRFVATVDGYSCAPMTVLSGCDPS